MQYNKNHKLITRRGKENIPGLFQRRIMKINPFKISLKISGIYLALGCLWILTSDQIAARLITDKAFLTRISIIKGLVYVLTTTIIIFLLSIQSLKKVQHSEKRLLDSYQELKSTHHKLESAYREITLSEEKLRQIAYSDSLTQLPNMLALQENNGEKLTLPVKQHAAMLFIDMDNFKNINDTMGHAFGDMVIVEVSKRLVSLLEKNQSIYRPGGDEFIIIARENNGRNDAENLAAGILDSFKDAFMINGIIINISLSIGVVIYRDNANSAYDLLKSADIAMYKAKEQGKNKYVLYNQHMKDALTFRINMEKNLRTALGKNEFEIYYQPQYNTIENRITGLEALLRWKSPELGFVPPLEFIPVAEDTHLIIPLGNWVLKTSCLFLKKLQSRGRKDLTLSVNISILQLLQSDFVNTVKGILDDCEILPCHLELEITETILIESFDTVCRVLNDLKKTGISIALDDFGKGYSSLSYLKQLPISTLKIDKTFIDSISDSDDKSLTRHIVMIGNSLGMHVIAEGVEKQEQLDYLIRNHCQVVQGYLFSKPLPENDLLKLMNLND